MRVLEATNNTIEAIRKAWELRHDLTSSDARNYSLSAGTRKKDSYEYSGEFAVRIAESEIAEDGSLASVDSRSPKRIRILIREHFRSG